MVVMTHDVHTVLTVVLFLWRGLSSSYVQPSGHVRQWHFQRGFKVHWAFQHIQRIGYVVVDVGTDLVPTHARYNRTGITLEVAPAHFRSTHFERHVIEQLTVGFPASTATWSGHLVLEHVLTNVNVDLGFVLCDTLYRFADWHVSTSLSDTASYSERTHEVHTFQEEQCHGEHECRTVGFFRVTIDQT
ncbi:hypothetical protein D3C87_1629180 [compost metagenome]